MSSSIPAGTVIVLRDGRAGLEVLLLRRSATLAFAPDTWVFPGGRVDPADRTGDGGAAQGGYLGEQDAARRAASREALEEAGVLVPEADLVPFSHWMPPAGAERTFSTWFFVVAAGTAAEVSVDGGEIVEHSWATPNDVLARRDAGEIALLPPTWISLWHLAHHADVGSALAAIRAGAPPAYRPTVVRDADVFTCLYGGDAQYPDRGTRADDGARHRLIMDPTGWRFELSAG